KTRSSLLHAAPISLNDETIIDNIPGAGATGIRRTGSRHRSVCRRIRNRSFVRDRLTGPDNLKGPGGSEVVETGESSTLSVIVTGPLYCSGMKPSTCSLSPGRGAGSVP